ncbi:MAG: carotenoid oxygenase family protein, partial [Acetobacter malorum]|uniref:carotenoid oxygenase family protein n=1 Tax=Acetobacter malorum TaxID=178901 RepID=UPI0039E85C1F
ISRLNQIKNVSTKPGAIQPDFAQSRLVIFDAGHVADGPVASVTLPQRVPDGFHGSFVSDVFLDLERAL